MPAASEPSNGAESKAANVINYGSGVGAMPEKGRFDHIAAQRNRPAAARTCHFCGKAGHLQRDCPQRNQQQTNPTVDSEAPAPYVERRKGGRSPWQASASVAQLEHSTNMADVETLFSIIKDEIVRDQLIALSAAQLQANRMVKEVYLPLGRKMELVTCTFDGGRTGIEESENIMEPEHLSVFSAQFAGLPDKLRRTGVDGTLHRISRTVNPISGECTTVAARIGRVIQGHVEALLSTAHTKGVLDGRKSVLIIGPPNVGKTTVLREFARVLSEERTSSGQRHRVVAVVDKSLEIAGSGNIPHSSIGPCRVLQVDNPENQHASMIEAVENQSPDVVVVDEITNRRQAEAARTIAQRGVAIVATVHGAGLPSIINDPERRELVGGVTSGVLLSDTAAKERADGRKAVEKRRGDPAFDIAIEIRGFHDWIIHEDIGAAVDAYLDGTSTPAWRHRKVSPPSAPPPVKAEEEDKDSAGEASGEEGADEKAAARSGEDEEEAPGSKDELETVPLVASALPGDAWFEYCALAEGETLPEPGKREDVSVNFRKNESK